MSKHSFTIPEEPISDEEMARLSYTVSEQAASDSSDESPTSELPKMKTDSMLLAHLVDFNEIHKSLKELTSSTQGTHLEVVVDILKTLAILGNKIKNLVIDFQQDIRLSTNGQKKTESRLKVLICEQYALKIRVIIKELRDNHIFP